MSSTAVGGGTVVVSDRFDLSDSAHALLQDLRHVSTLQRQYTPGAVIHARAKWQLDGEKTTG